MPTYSFSALGIDQLVLSGPDPFSSNASRNSDVYGNTTLRLVEGADYATLVLSDDESQLHDGDGNQELAQPVTFNGMNWGAGTEVEAEYSYVLRPQGSSDPAEQITVYVLEFEGDVQGIATSARLSPETTYGFVNAAPSSDDPTVPYAELAVCFARGTLIETPRGPRPVETLRPGDRITSVDNGAVPIVWIGRQVVQGHGRAAPVELAAGSLGNAASLRLSPQHRVMVRLNGTERLVAAKALAGQPGIALRRCHAVEYWHLLCERHEVLFAQGAAVESMLPGPQALRALPPAARAEIEGLLPGLVRRRSVLWPPARRLLRPGRWRARGLRLLPGTARVH
ncbi:Hint domain-containing protein [Salipiger mucosus]|uniref:Hint domain-containing protein n=1 Tax=Salipiger mucosus DSM 16094 TaxID=1123237 RepID=S9RXY6_9RHOB|nr:Hint domain-containing protein [Salipiger mucosus]EPX78854.1 hypothetical protein Salmuc_04437 [Salipiger mucosus DSM 16094]